MHQVFTISSQQAKCKKCAKSLKSAIKALGFQHPTIAFMGFSSQTTIVLLRDWSTTVDPVKHVSILFFFGAETTVPFRNGSAIELVFPPSFAAHFPSRMNTARSPRSSGGEERVRLPESWWLGGVQTQAQHLFLG